MEFGFLRSRTAQLLTLVIVVQSGVYYGWADAAEKAPAVAPLADFPRAMGCWSVLQDGVVEKEVQEVLKADDTLTRFYGCATPPMGAHLFVAYFRTQRTGQAPHSPKNCLPGSGWTATSNREIEVAVAGRDTPLRVNRYLVSKGDAASLVMYWYHTRHHAIASEYWAKIYLVLDSLRYRRSDTALVKVTVPVLNRDEKRAEEAALQLIEACYSHLGPYFPG